LDRYDYKLNLDDRTLILKLHGGKEVKLKLLTSTERVEKFRAWSNYELSVTVKDGNVFVSVYFRKVVELRKPRTIVTVDVNLDNITLAIFTLGGKLLKVKRYKTPLRKILTHRIWIERIQRKYSKSWRFIRGVRRAIEKHGEKIRSIAWDYAHKIGDSIAELASRYSSIVVLENLNHLRSRVNGGSSFNKKLSLWFYRGIRLMIGGVAGLIGVGGGECRIPALLHILKQPATTAVAANLFKAC